MSTTPAVNSSLVSTTPAINPCHGFSVIAGVLIPAINLSPLTMTPVNNIACDKNTGVKFIASDNSTGELGVWRVYGRIFLWRSQ
jgi:hypothetical protein